MNLDEEPANRLKACFGVVAHYENWKTDFTHLKPVAAFF
jgi:hypothetical protein